MTPADRVKRHLEDNGIRQSHLAKQINMKYSTLNMKLNNNIKITAEEIEAICGALKIKPDTLIKPSKIN